MKELLDNAMTIINTTPRLKEMFNDVLRLTSKEQVCDRVVQVLRWVTPPYWESYEAYYLLIRSYHKSQEWYIYCTSDGSVREFEDEWQARRWLPFYAGYIDTPGIPFSE